jgi:O-antigen ligase
MAAASEFNAHNQFLEYLSTNGAIGGFVYIATLGFLLLLSIYKRDTLFTLIFLLFILANLTESMMVRIKGIEFYAIFTLLFLCGKRHETEVKNKSNHLYITWRNKI